jgi:hypothetical protein
MSKTISIMKGFEKSTIAEIKKNAERIELDFDLCEFKSGTYFHEVKDESMSFLKVFSPGISFDSTSTERVVSSSLIYNHTISGNTEKYLGSFPFDSSTLKFYVLDHKIVLYVDRHDRSKYMFEMEN